MGGGKVGGLIDHGLLRINQKEIKCVKTKFIVACSVFFQFTFLKIDREQVMKDFGKKFDANRFNQEILVVHQNDRDNKYDSILVSRNNIGKYWKEINNKFGRC